MNTRFLILLLFFLPIESGHRYVLSYFRNTTPVTVLNHSARHAKRFFRKTGSSFKIIIDKSDYELQIFDEEGWLATYPVVFGNKNQDDKRMEGDRLTPEGSFKITYKKIHKEWGRFMLLDYPTNESYQRFKKRKSSGDIPKSAKIGGGIGIHGTRPNEEFVVDKFVNWTNGCISVKYNDIFEIYDLVPIGTEVIIQK